MNKSSAIIMGIAIEMSMIGLTIADNDSTHYLSSNTWNGLYAGVDTGVLFNNVQLRSQQLGFTNPAGNCNTNSSFSTVYPGIQLGYMYQFSNYFISGIEANVTFNTNQNDTVNCNCPNNPNVSDRFSFSNQMQSSIKGRWGRVLNWNKFFFLPYLTVGASFAHVGLTYENEGSDFYSQNNTQTGGLVGSGVEWSFRKNWSLRAEYTYINYGNIIKMEIPSVYGLIDPNGNARIALNTNNISIAINYWI